MQQAQELSDKALKIDNRTNTQRLLRHDLEAAGLNVLVRKN